MTIMAAIMVVIIGTQIMGSIPAEDAEVAVDTVEMKEVDMPTKVQMYALRKT